MKKKIIIIAAVVLTVAAAVFAGIFSHRYASVHEAKVTFKNELNRLTDENDKLEKTKSELKNSVSETERSIEDKNEIGAEAEEYSAQLEKLQGELETANKTLTELEASIQKKTEYIEQAGKIKNLTKGRYFSASEKTLKCPSDIAEGRYIAEGTGNLLIYNSSYKLRISENLTTIDTNSFTFDIEEGESVKVEESVKFTTLK